MTSNLDTRNARIYLREFGIGMVGYLVAVGLAVTFGDGGPRYLWALLPLVPSIWIGWAVWRHLNRLDEYQRVLLLGQFAIGFAAMIATSLTLALLSSTGLSLQAGPWIIYGSGMIAWGIAAIVTNRRAC